MAKKDYSLLSREDLVSLLLKYDDKKKYGIVWDEERVPEKVVTDCQTHLPVLTEVKDKEIITNPTELTHLLIEGDNYHTLSVLNYTHQNKIDLIYIDPPYNTGNKDFIYNDKYVDTVDKYRHSKWLNFMNKRLMLAKELLTDNGVIFISIDDNEMAQLKMLCDKVFGEQNFIANLPRITKASGKTTNKIALNHDYVLVYTKDKLLASIEGFDHNDKGFKYKDEFVNERGLYKLNQTLDYDSLQYSPSLDYEIMLYGEKLIPGTDYNLYLERKNGNYKRADWAWRWSKNLYEFGLENGFIVLKKTKTGFRIYTKTYLNAKISKDKNGKYQIEYNQRKKPITSLDFTDNIYSNDNAKKELDNLVKQSIFDYPKPKSLIKTLIKSNPSKNITILDFFAGSGTTAQAVLELNKEDGGNRQFILATNNENEISNIVTFPRTKNVMQGYENIKGEKIEGLGNNLKYFKTSFVENVRNRDQVRMDVTRRCTEMLCVKEGIYDLYKEGTDWKVYNYKENYLAIYYDFSGLRLSKLRDEMNVISGNKVLYCFTSFAKLDSRDFADWNNIRLEAVPEPILKVYIKIFKENVTNKG